MLNHLFPLLFSVAIVHTNADCTNIIAEKTCLTAKDCTWQQNIASNENLCLQSDCGAGVRNWHTSFKPESTAFKFFDPCNVQNSAINVNIKAITEYEGNTDIKTAHIQNAFSWDVKWTTETGIYEEFHGQPAISNGFHSILMKNAEASTATIDFKTFLFSDNSLVFNIHINKWQYLSTHNYLTLCLNMKISETDDNELIKKQVATDDTIIHMLNDFEIHNNKNIYCSGSQIQLQSTLVNTDDENSLDLCYIIEPCAGDLFWSTKISYHKPTFKECTQEDARYRKDWLSMSDIDRSLYIEGFQLIRDNGKLDVITQSHSVNFMGRLHESSLFLYYHSYIIWETESAIRALGGKFSCFAMPFYDWTKDFGMESDPNIFYTGIGGDGSENYCITVDGKDDTISDLFKTPNLCSAMEHFPNCCLKRLRDPTQQLVPLKKLRAGMKFSSGEQFDSIVRIGHAGFHRFFGAIADTHMHTGYASDDPIFHLAHSYMDLLRVVWQDCHEYTFEYSNKKYTALEGEIKEMENPEINSDMYHVYCYGGTENSFTEGDLEHQTCQVLENIIHLDDEMQFFGMGSADWTIVGADKGAVSIRKIFNINPGTSWNVKYNVKKFYDDNPLLSTWCKGERDDEVSEIWGEIHEMDREDGQVIGWQTIQAYIACAIIMVLVIFMMLGVVLCRKYGWCGFKYRGGSMNLDEDIIDYGALSIC